MLQSSRVRLFCGGFFVLGALAAVLAVTLTPSLARNFGGRRGLLQVLARSWLGVGSGANHTPVSGIVESVEIPLVSPDGNFPDREERMQPARWFFPEISAEQLHRFLSACDLRPVERAVLLDRQRWAVSDAGCEISPPEGIVWSLSPSARAQIYSVLSRSPVNFPQCFPFRFPLSGFEKKFERAGLPEEQMALIRRLSYTNGNYLCFTDLQALRPALRRPEFNDLVATLYAVPTHLLRLRVNPDSDVEGMIHYWGRGGRERSITPLLHSLARSPGGATINVDFLLPTLARLRLYAYPYALKDNTAAREDCFFTAMNFFNDPPDTNFFDAQYTLQALRSDYVPVKSRPTFGDVVTLVNEQGETFHACVYIVDDYVFTKNGVDPQQPWVLMHLGDMAAMYNLVGKPGTVEFYRRNFLPAEPARESGTQLTRAPAAGVIAGVIPADQMFLTFSQRRDFAD